MSVYKKLMAARIRLHGMEIKKSGRNDFAKYNYMELADFLIPTQQIFAELGLCGVVSFTKDIATLTITDTEDGAHIILRRGRGAQRRRRDPARGAEPARGALLALLAGVLDVHVCRGGRHLL